MNTYQKYKIQQMFLQGVPQIPYEDGVGKPRGVCAHETANDGSGAEEDTSLGERNWEQQDWQNAFVHFFVDYQTILNVASIDYISWGCCTTGNKYYINCELDRTKDSGRFIQSYDRWVWLMAKLLFDGKLGVQDCKTLVSHKWVTDTYKEGDHEDPIAYLASHGKTWENVVSDVSSYYNQFEIESGITPTPIINIPQEDEDNMAMNLTDYEWQMLNNIWGQRYNNKQITDWSWMQKIHNKTMTSTELAFLNCVIEARKDNLSTDANSYGMN